MVVPTYTAPSSFQIPDLMAHCHFPLDYHKNGDAIAAESDQWYENGSRNFTEEKRRKLHGLKAGQLTAYCHHDCDDEHLRVSCDWLNFLFHLDDISDGMMKKDTEALSNIVMNALEFPYEYRPISGNSEEQGEEPDVSKLARDFWGRCIKDAGPGMQARFLESLALFFDSVNRQAKGRDTDLIPDLQSYTEIRRDNSGMKPCFDFLEYILRIDLPAFVTNDPIIKALQEDCNDFVGWSNDIYSYRKEQVYGETYNMVAILMEHNRLDLQGAVDYVGQMCTDKIDNFCENRKKIPSWGPELDRDVVRYVRGIEDWFVASVHWTFMTERYFGTKAADIRKTRLVTLRQSRD